MKTSFPTFLTGYAPGAADGWADVPKSSSVRVNVEQTGVTFGSVAWPNQGRTGTRRRLQASDTRTMRQPRGRGRYRYECYRRASCEARILRAVRLSVCAPN